MKAVALILALLTSIVVSAQASASQAANVTVTKVRFWSDSDVIYVTLAGSNLNPASCNGVGFWEVRAMNEEAKKKIYSMALVAKTTANTVRVEIHDSVCSGTGTNGYPTIWMMELE